MILACTACERQEQVRVEMPFSLYLPAGTVAQQHNGPRRAMGDPGNTETFALPNYLYIFVLWENNGNWEVLDIERLRLQDRDWELVRYTGSLMTENDSIFRCKRKLNIMLTGNGMMGRVYAIASSIPLDEPTNVFSSNLGSIRNLDQLLNLKINVSSNDMQSNLHNIYITPYNYEVGGKYYGSFMNPTEYVVPLDLMLYHIASKVDLQWYVNEANRVNQTDPSQAVRLTYLEARNLFTGNAYCFKPLRNEVASLPSTGYTIADIITPTDEGKWWEGRSYFYTIPYTVTGEPGYFPLQLRMGTNGTKESAAYYLTLKQPVDTTAVFAPWIRGVFNFTQPLGNTSETKIAS